MQKSIKYFLITLSALIIIAVIGIILLVTLVNPTHFKDQISKQVYNRTGRQLTINGDISWTFFPWLGLHVNETQLSNAPGFGNQPLAAVSEANISLQTLPLLRGQIAIGKLALKGLELHLSKNAIGLTNWQDLTTIKDSASETSAEQKTSNPNLPAINISSLDIQNAHITWTDQQQNHQFDIKDFNLQSHAIALMQEFPLSITAQIRTSATADPVMIKLQTNALLDIAQQHYLFKKLNLTAQLSDKKYPDGKLAINLQADVNTGLQPQNVSLEHIALSIANMKMSGNLQGINMANEPNLRGKIQIPSFNLRKLLNALGINELNTNDPRVLQAAALNSDVQISSTALRLSQLQLNLDDTKIHGNFELNDFAKPSYHYDLAADKLDLNRYLSPAAPDRAKPSANSQPASIAPDSDPFAALRDLRIQGRLLLSKLLFKKFNLTEFVVNVTANNGVIKLDPITAQLYSGSYAGILNIDARGASPVITMKHTLSGMQAEPLMQALSDTIKVQLSGMANIDAQLTATGSNTQAITRSLNGQVKFAFNKGILKGIDVEHYISTGLALIKRQPELKTPDTHQTPFGNLTGTFAINNGIAQNHDFLLRSDKLQATGQGAANLINQELDFRINASLLNPSTHQPQGFGVPIRISGPFTDASIRPDMEIILKQQAEKQVDQLKNKLGDAIEKRVGKELGDSIKKLNLDSLFK